VNQYKTEFFSALRSSSFSLKRARAWVCYLFSTCSKWRK